jgi:hypothetical protein
MRWRTESRSAAIVLPTLDDVADIQVKVFPSGEWRSLPIEKHAEVLRSLSANAPAPAREGEGFLPQFMPPTFVIRLRQKAGAQQLIGVGVRLSWICELENETSLPDYRKGVWCTTAPEEQGTSTFRCLEAALKDPDPANIEGD